MGIYLISSSKKGHWSAVYVFMMAADVLAPIRCQAISNLHAETFVLRDYNSAYRWVSARKT